MNKYHISQIQDYLEYNSEYCRLLKERFINEKKYSQNLSLIKQGFAFLGISDAPLKIFEGRSNFVIWLGRRVVEYEGAELALYIGHKKMGLPIPDGLVEKCPHNVIELIERAGQREYIQKFKKELKAVSFSPEIFLIVHSSLLQARTEHLLPSLLSDIDRIVCRNIKEAVEKIPRVYLDYLSQPSFLKVVKKISSLVREIKTKMEQELRDITLYSLRLKEQLRELYLEADRGLKEIIENDVEQGEDINIITQKTSNLFSRLDRLFLGNIYHLKDYEKRKVEIEAFLQQEEEFKYRPERKTLNRRKKTSELFDEYMFYLRFGNLTKEEDRKFAKILTQEFEQLHKQKNPSVALLNKFEKRGLLSVEIDFDAIKEAYHSFMKQVIIPYQIGQCLFDLVQCFPPPAEQPKRLIYDLANLKILSLEGKNILTVVDKKQNYPGEIRKFVETFRKCITILVYDIRGSSYMGVKLQNAAKEQRIKYKFAKEMADIVKKYGGFLLKDTGDGGLIWFAENSASLYAHLYTESITGRGIKLRSSIFSGAEFELIPAADSAKRAILCARDMVQRAEEFIRANFMHYREWFADVAERTLELDGITYALLPPEFKSLFRIGVGIASGVPIKDVVFSANSYGDPDLVGPIISDANLYSMERQPGRSVVICDSASLINLILNVEDFDYCFDEEDFEKYIKKAEEVRQNNHGYKFEDFKISVVPKGVHYLEELNKNKAVASADITEIYMHEDSLYNDKQKKIKLLYEIINT
ncbi:MAG TPA: hypothetical protein ENI34_05270 [candidate division WOR-3 bacterium]|uniref:Uncharacterized protein n=1 Tax=candidate division WOR-3 bacterium TaxID=2052148 RepID=A0A9C9EM34_UNCW3|nr:hypothetical protein [candidate division WOR-3 bacterium]